MKHTLSGKQVAILLSIVVIAFCALKYYYTPQSTETSRGSIYGLCPSGDLIVWGFNEYKMADENCLLPYIPYSLRRTTLRNITCVSGSSFGVMAVDEDGNLWGKELFGSLIPWECTEEKNGWSLVMTDVKAVATGSFQCIAIKTDGTLWIWGGSDDSGYNGKCYPQQVMENVESIYADGLAFFSITQNNDAYAYGAFGTPINEFTFLAAGIADVAYMKSRDWQFLTTDGHLLSGSVYTLFSDSELTYVTNGVKSIGDGQYTSVNNITWYWLDSKDSPTLFPINNGLL